ncbi:hypothetical protein H6G89_02605 [Oscillatoria sp. FACHB-1407]|uniref:Asr1405/Asl0597 family protein n=1 Tax=Oscillatoria sp. FACHB-1407 TaxID=2692847 RepID=UPI001683547C|nr:Asr1405/Asl0597 family protein [Oscillatoria sp. FACHB-1407]MBD2459926.1 hypothetical protein [Oscillatoria sp. FACHB-1407]
MDRTLSASLSSQLIEIPICDRWQVYYRLQELGIPCTCLQDGSLWAEINSPLAASQLWSITFQLNASRSQLIDWLNRCW